MPKYRLMVIISMIIAIGTVFGCHVRKPKESIPYNQALSVDKSRPYAEDKTDNIHKACGYVDGTIVTGQKARCFASQVITCTTNGGWQAVRYPDGCLVMTCYDNEPDARVETGWSITIDTSNGKIYNVGPITQPRIVEDW